jgi:Ala-tRNA(Pro) deacylase
MNGDPQLYEILEQLEIPFNYFAHPAAPTIDIAMLYWKDIEATHCKNLFFRNHKGNRHYLVIIDHRNNLSIRDLEQKLKQGKLSFASDERMMKFLGVTPGSVTPFGLIHDTTHHVHLFIDKNLLQSERISFHPCINTASLVIDWKDFVKFLNFTQNSYEFLELY